MRVSLFTCVSVAGALTLGGCTSSSDSDQTTSTALPTSSSQAIPDASSLASSSPSLGASSTSSPVSSAASVSSQAPVSALQCESVSNGLTNGRLNDAGKRHLLCLHNATRSRAALGQFPVLTGNLDFARDMNRLRWDDSLAQTARQWADLCQWEHSDRDARTQLYNSLGSTDLFQEPLSGTETVGENLAFQGSTRVTEVNYEFVTNGYLAWEAEGFEYSFGRLDVNDFCDAETCGHFTQLIWSDTYKLGCAVNYCPIGTVSNVTGATYLVCNYASTGNYVGSEPYSATMDQTELCENAPNNTSCTDGLITPNNYSDGL